MKVDLGVHQGYGKRLTRTSGTCLPFVVESLFAISLQSFVLHGALLRFAVTSPDDIPVLFSDNVLLVRKTVSLASEEGVFLDTVKLRALPWS